MLTCDAAPFMEAIHERMPVILEPDQEARCLAGDVGSVRDVLEPLTDRIETYRVSTDVNDASKTGPR